MQNDGRLAVYLAKNHQFTVCSISVTVYYISSPQKCNKYIHIEIILNT